MNIVYLGSGRFGIESLKQIANSSHKIKLIVTQCSQPAGRGRKIRQTDVCLWAEEHKLPIMEAENVNTPEASEKILSLEPDILVVIAFGQKISEELISRVPKGAINVHASLLPEYRGAAPVNHAIINGDKQTGVSIITLAQRMDAGDILAQRETDIAPDETAGELHDRLAKLSAPLLLETLDDIEAGKAQYQPQDESKVTKAPKLKKSDGLLDFTQPAETIRNKILGLWPWPGASVEFLSKQTGKTCRVTFAQADCIESDNPENLPPGTLDKQLNVICGKDALKIRMLKPAGKGLMGFDDFVNGRNCKPGDSFRKVED